ncbi:SMI1/KNR4 family protein [Candidatus Sumerlaeota bacterium]|nr:SMI1/KNR4 family protein [Candidatus Sumerlaeota bacterium]
MNDFLEHVSSPNPAFHCYRAGEQPETLQYTASVQNEIHPPASDADLQDLMNMLGEGCGQLKAFYCIHNGCRLYCHNGSSSIELFRIEEWEAKNQEWISWIRWIDDPAAREIQKFGIAFGEVCMSGNFFVWCKGKVYYSDAETGQFTQLANDFNGFLSLFAKDPAKLLSQLGCYTRFTDGETNNQWIPKVYLGDA